MPSVTIFSRAESACAQKLAGIIGLSYDSQNDTGDLSIDDWLEPDIVGKACFSISGGPVQTQNFGARSPAGAFLADAALLFQGETRAACVEMLAKLQGAFPIRRENGQPGIAPNVQNFEMTEHPTIKSALLYERNQDGDTIIAGRIWTLRAPFRVVYVNVKD